MSEIIKYREPVTHNVKILPGYYADVCAGVKRAELRQNDRDYLVGDILTLCEWDSDEEAFTGEYTNVTITHIADVSEFLPGYVLLSIERERAEPVSDDELNAALRLHGLNVEGHSQLSDAFRAGFKYARRATSPAPAVPEDIPQGLAGQLVSLLAHNIGDKLLAQKIWNACRGAMLNMEKRDG